MITIEIKGGDEESREAFADVFAAVNEVNRSREDFEATALRLNEVTARLEATGPFVDQVYSAMVDARTQRGLEAMRIGLTAEIKAWLERIKKKQVVSVWGMPITLLGDDFHNCFQIVLEDGGKITYGFVIPEVAESHD